MPILVPSQEHQTSLKGTQSIDYIQQRLHTLCDPPTFSWEENVRFLLHQLSSASLTNLVKISMQVIIVIMNLDWMSFLHETYLYLVSARTVVENDTFGLHFLQS